MHAFDCQYGAHIYDGNIASIYVNNWLAVAEELAPLFLKHNDRGFVGHCLLVFSGVRLFELEISQYTEENNKIIWTDPIIVAHQNSAVTEGIQSFVAGGSLHGFKSSVSISVEARAFELHILAANETAAGS